MKLSSVALVLPLVLKQFVAADVAVWQLFATLYTLMLLLDFGLSPTFSRMLSFGRGGASIQSMSDMRRAGDNPATGAGGETAAEVFSCLRWLYRRFAAVAVALIAVLGTFALVRPVAMTPVPVVCWMAWGVVLVGSGFGLWANLYAAALQGMGEIAPLRRVEVFSGLAQIGTSCAVLLAGGNLLELTIGYQAWMVFNAVRNRRLLKRLHPALFAVPAQPRRDVVAVLAPATWRSGVGMLMSHGIIQGSGLVYAQLASAAEVASYLLALRVITTVSLFSSAPFYSKLPQLAVLQASMLRDQQITLIKRGMRISHWVFTAAALFVAIFMQPMLTLIGSHTTFVSPTVWALLAFAFFVERYGAMHLQVFSLSNVIVWHIANGITGVLMVLMAIALYPHMGVEAMPAAMLLSYLMFYAPFSALKSTRMLKVDWFSFELRIAMAPALVLLAGRPLLAMIHL